MKKIRLNYSYRFPRVKFKNGKIKYGMILSYYDAVKKQLEYYFADANQIRKMKNGQKESVLEIVKQLKHKILPTDIMEIEYIP